MDGTDLKPLSCAGCGAPLPVSQASRVVCAYCGQLHEAASPPPRAPAPHRYAVGEAVLVAWGVQWWHATILDVVAPGAYRIHYDGWGDEWDEDVVEARVRPRGARDVAGRPLDRPRRVLLAAAALALACPLSGLALWLLLSGLPAGREGASPEALPGVGAPHRAGPSPPLSVGQAVRVEWHGGWYDAVVIDVRADGRVRIHYVGWSDAWDADVERAAIAVDASAD